MLTPQVRLRHAAKLCGGIRALGKKSGVQERTLASWLAGTEPKSRGIAAVAKAAGVSLEWLITGAGEEQPSGGAVATSGPLNEALLQVVITAIEELLFERGLELTPAKKARAIALAFELFQEDGAVDRETVIQLIQLAA